MEDNIISKMLKRLEDETDLIKYFSTGADMPAIDNTVLNILAKEFHRLEVVDNSLCFINSEGETERCPHVDTNVSDAGYWLSDKIPMPWFDITQSGNLQRAEEAESIYICINICSIFKDDSFKDEFNEVIKAYDFNKMSPVGNSISFTELLTSWQELQSVIINVIVSACKYSISSQKKEEETFLRDGLPNSARDALRDLALKIKMVNFDYSNGALSRDEVKKLSKIQILVKIEERNEEINNLISQSKYGDLYKTLKLSTEYLSPITKKKINNFCNLEVESLYNSDASVAEMYGDMNSVLQKFRKRAYKVAINSLRREYVLEYIKDPSSYVLPRKG